MRIRRLMAVLLLAAGSVVAVPGVAHASGGAGELRECLEKAAQQKTTADIDQAAKDCYSAPNPLIPEIGEVFWGALAFAIVAFGLIKFGFPALRDGLKQREAKIQGDLEAAEAAKAQAERELAEYRAQLADARSEAGRIIEEARTSADQVRKDLIARAEADAAEQRARASEDIRLATDRAMADLQGRVAELSIELAERVVERNLDRDTQIALIEGYINEVGGTRA